MIPTLVSLFCGGGFGDTGFRQAGLRPIFLTDIDPQRAALAEVNFPEARVCVADVALDVPRIARAVRGILDQLGQDELFLLSATPPCQGMSKNGIGTLLRSKKRGMRPKSDPRNRLYRPVIQLVKLLRPRWVFFENVCRMMNTYEIDKSGKPILVPVLIEAELHSQGYSGTFEQVQLADYGLPQTRLRAVGVFRLINQSDASPCGISYLPPRTNDESGIGSRKPWKTLREAIGHLPPLDSRNADSATSDFHPLHRVPVWRPELYEWMAATPEGRSAFDNNSCQACAYENSRSDLFCRRCKRQLMKPVVNNGEPKLIRGFISAYKRMYFDRPASTVTTRSAYACSDHKAHPTQDRVLSTYEAAIVQGVNPRRYKWRPLSVKGGRTGKVIPDTLARDLVGECVPPLFTARLGEHLLAIEGGRVSALPKDQQLSLY